MDNKIIVLIVAAIAAVGLIAGFALLGGGGAPPDGKEFVGEWKAYYAMGYNEEGVYFTEDDPVLLDNYDFEVDMASDSLFTATYGALEFEGTYSSKMMNSVIAEGLKTTVFQAALSDNGLIVNKITYTGAGALSVTGILMNHDGVMPKADAPEPVVLPEEWVMKSGVAFNGTVIELLGDSLTITKQNWPFMYGNMDQQVGTEMVPKDFIAVAMPTISSDAPDTLSIYKAVDESGMNWTMYYDSEAKVFTAATAEKSDINSGTTSGYRIYSLPGGGDVKIPTGESYVGTTWKTETLSMVGKDGKVVKSDYTITVNITAQKDTMLSGTMTLSDGTVLDYSAILTPFGWTYADCKNPLTEGRGSATLSSDSSSLFVRDLYKTVSKDGTSSWNASTYTLKKVEPMPANALLGEWQCQSSQTVDETGAFKTETRSEGALEKWDLNILSVKGGMFVGTFDGTSIVGSAPGGHMKSQVSSELTLVATVDAKGNLQAHLITVDADGANSISSLVYTHGTATTETASAVEIKGVYGAVHAQAYDGNTVRDLGGTALNITDQQGTLFKGTIEVEHDVVETVDVIGYITVMGENARGSIIIGEEISSLSLRDYGLSMTGATPTDEVYARLYIPVGGDDSDAPERESLVGTWKNGESNKYTTDGNFSPNVGYVYDMKITEHNGIFVRGEMGASSFIGTAITSDYGVILRLYITEETGLEIPFLVILSEDGSGVRTSTYPMIAVVTEIEESAP